MASPSDDFPAWLERMRVSVDRALDAKLPGPDTPPPRLHQAMRHAVLNGGKRLRAILCLTAAETVSGSADSAWPAALGLELLHAYTLVHDDLPAMDDSPLRRGRPSCHVAFGEAVAILAGDALLTLAWEWLAETAPAGPWTAADLVRVLARAAGSHGVAGGQVDDLDAEGRELTEAEMKSIHDRKTGVLLTASLELGAMAAGADEATLGVLRRYGTHLGLAFQIADDILDATADADVLGKPTGHDAELAKSTYVSLFGVDEARRKARAEADRAIDALADSGLTAPRLERLARYMVDRTS